MHGHLLTWKTGLVPDTCEIVLYLFVESIPPVLADNLTCEIQCMTSAEYQSLFSMSHAVLPECLNKDDIITGEMHARHCCVDTEEGVSYRWSGNLVLCVGKGPLKGSLHSCFILHLSCSARV